MPAPPHPHHLWENLKMHFFYWLESIHHFLCTLAHPAGGFAYTKDLWLSFLLVLCKSSFFCNTHCIDWVNLIVWRQILVNSGTTSSWLHLARIPHNIRDGVPLFLLLSNLCVGTEDFGWAPAQLSAQSTNTFDTSSVCVVKTDATYMESRTFALTNR